MNQFSKPPFIYDNEKPIRLNVYKRDSDCSRNGVSNREHTLYAFTDINKAKQYVIDNPRNSDSTVILDIIYDQIRAFPVNKLDHWQMFGGNIAVICHGSNFDETARKYCNQVINIMDRIETSS